VLGAKDLSLDGQEGSQLVACCALVSCCRGPAGEVGLRVQRDILLKVELEASDRRSGRLGPGPFPGAYDHVPSHT
jgi:hypothetical protein